MDNTVEQYTPAAIVAELDRYIIGQREAKRAVAIALRDRLRRQRLPKPLRDEIRPKNILMIGSTGIGKTEIARRVANLVKAPFIIVDATKFTEIGYTGRDVESIVRDLTEVAIRQLYIERLDRVEPEAERAATARLADYLVRQRGAVPARRVRQRAARHAVASAARRGANVARQTSVVLAQLGARQIEDETVAIDLAGPRSSARHLSEGSDRGGAVSSVAAPPDGIPVAPQRPLRVPVREARRMLIHEEAGRLVDFDDLVAEAIRQVEEGGIVFLDEVDKLVSPPAEYGGVSSEGVQRDLLPIIEGTAVVTPHGPVKSDHILFIGAGAFTDTKPADLIPEFQGRFPLRVELHPLSEDDLLAVLTEPENALARQYAALLETEGLRLDFRPDGLREIATTAALLNEKHEDIGARRLATIVEQVLEEVSFEAPDRPGQEVVIDAGYVRERVGDIAADEDLSNFIL